MKLPKLTFKLPSLTIRWRLRIVLGLLMLMLLVGALIGFGSMQLQNEALRHTYQEELVPANLISSLNRHSLLSFVTLGEAVSSVGKPDQVKQKVADFQKQEAQQMMEYLRLLKPEIFIEEPDDVFTRFAGWLRNVFSPPRNVPQRQSR